MNCCSCIIVNITKQSFVICTFLLIPKVSKEIGRSFITNKRPEGAGVLQLLLQASGYVLADLHGPTERVEANLKLA
jgi:hypothetical protein